MGKITTYLVSYHFTDEKGRTGFGDTTITIDKRVQTSSELIEKIRKRIKNEYNLENVVFFNIIPLKS